MAEYYQLDKTFLYLYLDLYLDLVWNKDTRSKKEYIIYKVFDLNINIYIYIYISIYLYLSIYLSISLSLSLYLSISLSLYLSIYLSWNRKTDRSIDGSVDRCRDTSSLPHVFYSVNLASIWLQARFSGFWGRIQKHTRIHQHHAFIFGGLKQCGNDNSCPHARQTARANPTPGGKEELPELPYKKPDRAKRSAPEIKRLRQDGPEAWWPRMYAVAEKSTISSF